VSPAQPIELIQARNLISRLMTAAFLVDSEGVLLFFNDRAGELLGVSFEEAGPMQPGTWGTKFKPREPGGAEIEVGDLPLAIAVQSGRPGFARMEITGDDGSDHLIEVTAFPIMSGRAQQGSVAIFWPVVDDDED
jgi:PAS domain-containing protein